MNRYFIKYIFEDKIEKGYIIAPTLECAIDCILYDEIIESYLVESNVTY